MSYTSHDPEQGGLWDRVLEEDEPCEEVLMLSPKSPGAIAAGVKLLRPALARMLGDPALAARVTDRTLESIARQQYDRWRAGLLELVQLLQPGRVTADGLFVGQLEDGLDGEAILRAIERSNV